MTIKFKKQLQNQAQDGRSMIEMLGVLAIIAILSIGGIVGYKLAMNYYQADQIANEINLMRNDLKVKYALGNEELLLGDPYDDTPADENYSGHLSTQYDRYPVDYDCIRKDKAEFYNCRETDAYYIKVGNVSKGVCKPLTTLVAAMDGRWEMTINDIPYTEGDSCTGDENNEIYIEFDAKEVNGNYDSNRPEGWCAKDEDCEEPQVCDEENNMCVECTENAHCTSNICRKNHTCGECTKDSDCTNIEKPKCNQNTNTCELCPPEKSVWTGSQCVECITSADCTDIDKPNCNPGTNTCESCPENSFWDGGKCQEGCRENNHCAEDEYCYKIKGASCENEWENEEDFSGSCRKVNDDLISGTVNGKTYYGSKNTMNWWSAERFCKAAGQSGHGNGQTAVWGKPDFKCNPSFALEETLTTLKYCYSGENNDATAHSDKLSTTVNELRSMFGVMKKDNDNDLENIDIWLDKNSSSCGIFEMVLGQKEGTLNLNGEIIKGKAGRVHLAPPHTDMSDHALCQPQ